MTDRINEVGMEERLRQIDPLNQDSLPSPAETEAALARMLVLRPAGAGSGGVGGGGVRLALPRRPRVLMGGSAGAVALTVALALLLGASASTPAFAVTRHRDGTVTVRLMRLSGINGANRRLAALGIKARIVKAADLAKYVARLHPCLGQPAGSARAISFNPARIPARRMLLLPANRTAHLSPVPRDVRTMVLTSPPALRRARALVNRAIKLAAGHPAGAGPPAAQNLIVPKGTLPTVQARGDNQAVRIYCARPIMRPATGHR